MGGSPMRWLLKTIARISHISWLGAPQGPAGDTSVPGPVDWMSNEGAPDLDTNMKPARSGPQGASETARKRYIAQLEAGGFDEMFAADSTVRPHWQAVLEFIDQIGFDGCTARSERVQRRIVENGLTLDSFSDLSNVEQPWRLDLVPLVIEQAEWKRLEAAVIQRMRLNEAILTDLYGPQALIDSGALPAGLVFNDPTFLRPMSGVASRGRLTFMAIDLARDKSGQWRVLDTHAETIAGHGYALANRVVVADVCANLFRSCNIIRLSSFYQDVAQELARRSGQEAPAIAILGPNPDHENYLSHAYMARYLGYLLLEGSDLRIAGDKVFHKTLAGLQPIDLLVRAVEAGNADPLELNPDGFDGPAGLVQAVRANPDLIANALGTAIVENRGIASYLPAIAEQLSGESLLLPDASRLWLGDTKARAAFLAEPDAYLVRPASEPTARPGHATPGQKLNALEADERAALLIDIELNGARYVAERPSSFATAPSWSTEGLVAKPYALRLFVAATEGGYSVMPGGLALTVDAGVAVGLTAPAAESRDVWVASTEVQGPHYSRWRISEEETQVQRLGNRLPSRVADNLFWLGRYVERADWTLRVMRNSLSRGDEDLRPIRRGEAAQSAIEIIVSKGRVPADAARDGNGQAETVEARVEALFSATGNPYGVRETFQNIRRVARQGRDRLSLDAWRLLSSLSIQGRAAQFMAAEPAVELVDRLDRCIAELAAFNGLMHENMTRNFGWHFIDLGRRIERAYQLAELLRKLLISRDTDEAETDRLAFLLETADTFMTYRARYRFAPVFPLVLDLLLVDETNPRGIAFQLSKIVDHLGDLPKASQDAVRTPEQRLALEMLTQVRLADIDALRMPDATGARGKLRRMLDQLIQGLPELSDIISRRYFSLTEEQPQRVHTRLSP
jgi:uncharacterized circularly permuted ATP-grasp superfamily protein/uncharacterized alpha-E superfamily protein